MFVVSYLVLFISQIDKNLCHLALLRASHDLIDISGKITLCVSLHYFSTEIDIFLTLQYWIIIICIVCTFDTQYSSLSKHICKHYVRQFHLRYETYLFSWQYDYYMLFINFIFQATLDFRSKYPAKTREEAEQPPHLSALSHHIENPKLIDVLMPMHKNNMWDR